MKAMILAAGLGTRMRPLTDHCPKPLLKVAGKPLIEHHIERLAKAGFRDIIINVSYLGEQIQNYLGNGERWNLAITYSVESSPLETGGGIFKVLDLLNNKELSNKELNKKESDEKEPFLVINGDVWCDIDLAELALGGEDLGLLVLVNNPVHNPQGDFCLVGNRVQTPTAGVANTPALIAKTDTMTFSGVSVLHPDLFKDQVSGKFPLAPLLRSAMAEGRIGGIGFSGYWLDVGTPERLQELDNHLIAAC